MTEAAQTEAATPYDEIPYGSRPFPQTHPNHTGAIGALFGMQPAGVDACRVLELGCAAGGNLIPVAAAFPGSSFIGVDLSARQIADGKETIAALGLKNIELRCQSIAELDSSLGRFDYIISHGVYSWVTQPLREKLLSICCEVLAPQGIAYVSYNTRPGWGFRSTVRDMMLYHIRNCHAPADRAAGARALLDSLVQCVADEQANYRSLLQCEFENVRRKTDDHFLHDHLEEENHPVYFHEFAKAAQECGLSYLAEAAIGSMSLDGLPGAAGGIMRELAGNVIEYEQYLDFMRNRTFRQTLLCRKDVAVDRSLDPERVRGLFVASRLATTAPINFDSGNESTFRANAGSVTTRSPLMMSCFEALRQSWPEALSFEQLLDRSLARFPDELIAQLGGRERAGQGMATYLVQCFARRVVDLYLRPPPVCAEAGDRPCVSALARLQAAAGSTVTTLLHESSVLGALDRRVALLADGTRSRQEISEQLLRAVRSGELDVYVPGGGSGDEQLQEGLGKSVDESLTRLARLALVCG